MITQLLPICATFSCQELVQYWFGTTGTLALLLVGTGLRSRSAGCVVTGLLLTVAVLLAQGS